MFCQKLRTSFRLKNVVGYVSDFNQSIKCKEQGFVSCCYNALKNEHFRSKSQSPINTFCTQKVPKTADVFGDISGRKFEHFDMDKPEQEEEKFQDNEGCVPRRLKPSLGQYAKMIKSHISKGDLDSALQVLDLVKENRDKPTIYMYNLLMRAFSRQGNMKKCFSLYNKAKKRDLQPNSATYTSLFNACAVSKNSVIALEYMNNLRQMLYQQQFPMNETHYNVMIKAYNWHNEIVEAFQLADEMRDKRIPIGESTYNSLFHGAIGDKEAGLRHALIIWHLMRFKKIKPSLTTYNLFLRTIRDTKFGNLKIDDVLVSGLEQTKISLKENERPDLLASPPVLSTLLHSMESSAVQQITDGNKQVVPQIESLNLNDVLVNNRLILFGGLEGFLKRMAEDDVTPDAKTITLLLDLIPDVVFIENLLIKVADEKNITLDIDFYNMLIKKRSMRSDYKAAKEVISMVEQKNLSPNVMTFGVLAFGCRNSKDAKEFLEGINAFGYVPNAVIMSTLINVACYEEDFEYILFAMDYMVRNHMRPNARTIKDLEEFSKTIRKMEKPTGKYRFRKTRRLDENVQKFEQQYLNWQKRIKGDKI